MRGIRFSFLVSFLFCTAIFSQNKFEYDYARFYNPQDSSGYIELYYSFVKSALKSVTIDGNQVKQGQLVVKIVDLITDEIVVDNFWNFDIDKSNDDGKLLVGVLEFPLDYSKYLVEISANDINESEYRESSTFELNFTPFIANALIVSDIELATSILPQSQNTESIFYKNSIEVTPNPGLIYGDKNPVIFFYSEIYGLAQSSTDYLVEQKLFDSKNNLMFEKQRSISGDNSSVVEVGAIKVNEFMSGVYTLVISVKNNADLVSSHSAKKVYVYNRDLIDQSTNFAGTELSPLESELLMMSEEELNYMFETAQYIATEFEIDQWKKLRESDSKRNFLSAFWEKRDSDLSTNINEYRIGYYDRVNYANKSYGNLSRREGWKTDRGRVYIKYGAPGEIERFQNEYYSKPYEIWQYYNLEGGVIFLFADEEGLNIYRLVHSTKKGEIYNYNNYLKYVQ